jgi:signal peptidase I
MDPEDERNPERGQAHAGEGGGVRPSGDDGGWVAPPLPEWEQSAAGAEHGAREYRPAGETPAYGGVEVERPHRFTLKKLVRDVFIPLVVAFAVAMIFQATVAKPYKIPSGSMLPTIQLGDRILANRVVYRYKDIQRGDVVVFQPPSEHAGGDPGVPFVKRVVGLPGDTVEVRNGRTLVNGEVFEVSDAVTPTYTQRPETVPDGQLFVLGDNRNESSDSHIWGYVPIENVIGRVELIYWPPQHMKLM